MKNKITILILTSVLALLALSSIQTYLIYNSYQLKKAAFISETDNAMSNIHTKKALDDLFDDWGEDLKNHLADYQNHRISKNEVIERLQNKADSNNVAYKKQYQEELKKLDFGYDVNYKTVITSIIILKGSKRDTILTNSKGKETRLFGEDFDNKEAITINKSNWFSENEFIGTVADEVKTTSYSLEVNTKQLILIKDWKRIVLKRLASLLITSILLFLFVIGLLYYSIKNLITQKKTAEIKTDFINNITHELKTPLATLSIATKSLKNEAIRNDASKFDTTLNIVERQNNRLQQLIDQVLTNSLSSEDIVLSKQSVTDAVYFSELIEDFKLSTQRTDISLELDLNNSEVMLRIDKFHFTTALFNILENAVKYGSENPSITMKTFMKNGMYTVQISDNGIGIPSHELDSIFDKFYRVSEGNLHEVKGLGLGLYYTKQIITAHHGTILVESEPHKGTTFTIKIPVT